MRGAGPPPPHRATTAHLQAVYPLVAGAGLGWRGAYLGRDLHGGAFCFDSWELYAAGVVTSTNTLVVGQIGRGKSTFVKTLVWRQLVFGRQAWIVDPKGEYGPLARAAGAEPIRLQPGGSVRLNPLDPGGDRRHPGRRGPDRRGPDHGGPERGGPESVRRGAELLASVAESSLRRPLSPAERTALELGATAAARRCDVPTVPAVVDGLLDPDADLAASVRTDAAGLAADGRAVALELRRLVGGDLAGMFDGPTTEGIDLDAGVVVLDLSALYDSPALGILMTCATAWLQAALRRPDGVKRLVVVDEAWAILHDLSTARWLQAGFKLSRAYGAANVAVVHRLSDLRAAGGEGSTQQRLAEGLLADTETRVVFGQPASEVAAARTLLGLTTTEADLLAHLPRAVALWRVGDRSFLVEHALGPDEVSLVDTDEAMRPLVAGPEQ